MPVALLFLVAVEGVRCGMRQYNKVKAKKYRYDGVLGKDSLGRPVDENTGRRLTRNEARALAEHRRGTATEAQREREWRSKGDALPDYSQASLKGKSHNRSTSSSSESSQEEEDNQQNWQDWSISGAPCYTEQDEIAPRTSQLLSA